MLLHFLISQFLNGVDQFQGQSTTMGKKGLLGLSRSKVDLDPPGGQGLRNKIETHPCHYYIEHYTLSLISSLII